MSRIAAVLAAVLAAPGLASAEVSTWSIDPSHSEAEFHVRHMMVSTVDGSLGTVTGTIRYDDRHPDKSSVEASIDVNGIDTRFAKRDQHLKSADFFDVAKYPTATFKSTSVKAAGKGKLLVKGDLTLHGVTRPVTLHVAGPTPAYKDPWGGTHRGFSATTKIDRADYGLTWNKALEGGGWLVGKDVAIDLTLEILPAAPATPAAAAK